MNTPITDAAANESIAKVYETSKRLELDRAALMESLQEIHHESDMGSFAENRAFSALAAARANFPTP